MYLFMCISGNLIVLQYKCINKSVRRSTGLPLDPILQLYTEKHGNLMLI